MKTILDRLREKIDAAGERAFFNPPASEEEIAETEEKLGITFPRSVREFYRVFNGGFIAYTSPVSEEPANDEMFEDLQWNSNTILSLEEIRTGFGKRYPEYTPVIHTHSQEFLAFGNPLVSDESPIYDAFHEFTPDKWGILYDNFEALLIDYIEKEGAIKTIAV